MTGVARGTDHKGRDYASADAEHRRGDKYRRLGYQWAADNLAGEDQATREAIARQLDADGARLNHQSAQAQTMKGTLAWLTEHHEANRTTTTTKGSTR